MDVIVAHHGHCTLQGAFWLGFGRYGLGRLMILVLGIGSAKNGFHIILFLKFFQTETF
jgi:hypothetical protein